ncbi:MAG TPA: glycosyltransferase family 1 protein, partial [Thermoanaerobaculia bacterium]|nr:glycosyltransferase family 1 protein [Thermoanaerobaculia bacterium]
FYLGALLAAGRVNPLAFESDPTLQSLIAIAPFGVPPARGQARVPVLHGTTALSPSSPAA